MNVTPVQFFSKNSPKGATSLFRQMSAIICIFLICVVPALADPITGKQVVQTLNSSQGTLDLRLNSLVTQDPATTKSNAPPNGPRAEGAQGTQPGAPNAESIAVVAITSEGQELGVDYEEGEVDGTICDCGEIPPILGGGFPKWPFLFLGAVPLAFIHDCDDCGDENEQPTPTPTPTPTPPSGPTPTPTPPGVPEPGTLLLFGSGLVAAGAGLRRRYAKMKLTQKTEEEE